MDFALREFQQEIINKIVSAFNEKFGKACISMPIGTGKNLAIKNAISNILEHNPSDKILCLFRMKCELLEFTSRVELEITNKVNNFKGGILAITYNEYLMNFNDIKDINFNLIVCHDAEHAKQPSYNSLLEINCDLLLGVFSHKNNDEKNIFFGSKFIYDGKELSFLANEYTFIKNIIVPMLELEGYKSIETDKLLYSKSGKMRIDVVAEKEEIKYFIEFKAYKGAYNDKSILKNAIERIIRYKNIIKNVENNLRFGIILLCVVDEKIKEEMMTEYGIFIWDIKNILYICNGYKNLSELLTQYVPYSLNHVEVIKPLEFVDSANGELSVRETSYEKDLINKLKKCKAGNENYQEFEKICSSIISYLFKTEFSQFSEQHTTNDEMFRMDIICGLKGTTAFWDFLIKYYNTKFVVFECKNYSEEINQNLIYVTEKYLFTPALRNVAFIISRKGFSNNAEQASLGILKEHGKLIIDLTDRDLEIMVESKANGNEPSDYLLDKIEKLLMGISI